MAHAAPGSALRLLARGERHCPVPLVLLPSLGALCSSPEQFKPEMQCRSSGVAAGFGCHCTSGCACPQLAPQQLPAGQPSTRGTGGKNEQKYTLPAVKSSLRRWECPAGLHRLALHHILSQKQKTGFWSSGTEWCQCRPRRCPVTEHHIL